MRVNETISVTETISEAIKECEDEIGRRIILKCYFPSQFWQLVCPDLKYLKVASLKYDALNKDLKLIKNYYSKPELI